MPAILNKNLIKAWIWVFLWMAFIFVSSSFPGNKIPKVFNYQDLVFHLSVYFILGGLLFRALVNTSGKNLFGLVLWSGFFCIIYAITDEFHQSFVPYRDASVLDLFIDGLGGYFGSTWYYFKKRKG